MIRKIHILSLFFLLILFIGTVSANEDSNLTQTITTEDYSLETSDVEMYYKDGTSFNVKLLNKDNVGVGEKINITINGVTYKRTTNSSGMAKLNINLHPGEYKIKTDSILDNQKLSVINTIKIKEMNTSLQANKIVNLPYKEGKYDVKLIGGDNKPLKDKTIYLTINGVTYKRITNNLGEASININLNPGTYIISAKFSEYFHQTAEIRSTINVGIYNTRFLSNPMKTNRTNIEYSVKLVYDDLKPVVNHDVTFHIQDTPFTVKTNNEGIATFKNTLTNGNYQISFEFKGSSGFYKTTDYNTIEINTNNTDILSLETSNVEMYYKDGTSFNVKLLNNNQSLINETVNITINGVTYKRTTNSSGMAKLNINLHPGTYLIKTSTILNNYHLIRNNIITIKEIPSKFIADPIVNLGYKEGKYDIKLVTNDNKPLKDKTIYLTINGVTYKRITNNLGEASININLNPGTYIISAKFSEYFHQSAEIKSTINIGIYSTKFISNSTKYDKINIEYSIKLVDNRNHPVKNVLVFFSVNQIFDGTKTNNDGIATFKEVLNPGKYKISFEFFGNIGYLKSKSYNIIQVVTDNITIQSNDFETYVDSPIPYLIGVKDQENSNLINVTVKSDVYKDNKLIKTIQSKTYEDGVARINFDLNPGQYVIKNQLDNSNCTNTNILNIKTASLIAITSDLTLNRKGEAYTVILKNNETYNPLANQTVIITINGVNYKRITDENGIAKLNINLNYGNYAIYYNVVESEKYPSLKGNNTIHLTNSVLTPKLEFITSEIIRKGTYCEIRLVDNNNIPLKDKTVYISVNNIAYKRITDANGVAKLKINLNDGDYTFRGFFEGDTLFKQVVKTAHIKINTTPTFEYAITIESEINYKNFVCPIIKEFTIDYNNMRYELKNSGEKNCPKITEKNSYFISNDGISSVNTGKQGLEFKLINGHIQFKFYGKTSEVGQFSVIYSYEKDSITKIDYIIDNEVVGTVRVYTAYGYDDYYKLLDLGYSFLTLHKGQSIFKQGNDILKREVSFDIPEFRMSLKNHPTFSDFDTIQTYLLTSKKIDQEIMENKIEKAIKFNENYPKYAYELYLSSLMTMWSSDTFADEYAKELNVTWNKNNQIILTNIDWAQLTLDAHTSINVYGNQSNVKLFKLQYGISYSSCEQFGIKSTYNNASSVVGDIFNGIYMGQDFVIDEKGNTLILRLVNSSNSININKVTGDTNVTKVTDINTITSNMVLKGCGCIFYISKKIDIENLFGTTVNAFKYHSNELLDLIFSIKPRQASSLLQEEVKNILTIGVSYKFAYTMHPIALIFLGIDLQKVTLEYRNKFTSDDKWQYFSSHGSTLDVKTIAVVNKITGYVDYIEIPYDDENLNMEEARYIDAISGKRNLTNEEKIKYRDYDVFAQV